MKLWKVTIEATVIIASEGKPSRELGEQAVSDWFDDGDQKHVDIRCVEEVKRCDWLPRGWPDSTPYNTETTQTCREILAEQRAEDLNMGKTERIG